MDDNNHLFAFEIENTYIGVKKTAYLLNSINSVTDVNVRKLFSSPFDVHITFKYINREFVVWEPFADSSRYWVGPNNLNEEVLDIDEIEDVFRQYELPLFIKLIKFFVDMLLFKK